MENVIYHIRNIIRVMENVIYHIRRLYYYLILSNKKMVNTVIQKGCKLCMDLLKFTYL